MKLSVPGVGDATVHVWSGDDICTEYYPMEISEDSYGSWIIADTGALVRVGCEIKDAQKTRWQVDLVVDGILVDCEKQSIDYSRDKSIKSYSFHSAPTMQNKSFGRGEMFFAAVEPGQFMSAENDQSVPLVGNIKVIISRKEGPETHPDKHKKVTDAETPFSYLPQPPDGVPKATHSIGYRKVEPVVGTPKYNFKTKLESPRHGGQPWATFQFAYRSKEALEASCGMVPGTDQVFVRATKVDERPSLLVRLPHGGKTSVGGAEHESNGLEKANTSPTAQSRQGSQASNPTQNLQAKGPLLAGPISRRSSSGAAAGVTEAEAMEAQGKGQSPTNYPIAPGQLQKSFELMQQDLAMNSQSPSISPARKLTPESLASGRAGEPVNFSMQSISMAPNNARAASAPSPLITSPDFNGTLTQSPGKGGRYRATASPARSASPAMPDDVLLSPSLQALEQRALAAEAEEKHWSEIFRAKLEQEKREGLQRRIRRSLSRVEKYKSRVTQMETVKRSPPPSC